jgi:hypothetical protein
MTWIKKAYLYLVSLISLVILIIAGIMLINMALKTWVFPKADNNYYSAPIMVNCAGYPNDQERLKDPACADPDFAAKEEARVKEDRSAQKQRDAAQALAMIIVATPVFYYHWKLARKES